jgi:hypothetical protein
MRRRVSSPHGGPYIDFTAQLASGNGAQVDFDARIQMDYGTGFTNNAAINPNSGDFSAITFQTGGNGYYSASNPSNVNGRVIERLRIGKAGEIGIEAGPYIGNGNVVNNRTDAQKYGTTGQVLTSNGKGSSVSWETVSGGSVTINNNVNNHILTATGTANTLQGESELTWDGGTLYTNHTNGRVEIIPGNGCIELTRTAGDAFIDFKNVKTEDGDIRIAQYGTSQKLQITNIAGTGGDLDVVGTITNIAVAKAFVNFHGGTNTNGNCTMRDAFGVSSVADIGTGNYRIYWTSSFSNVNYTVATAHSSAPNNGSTHGILYTYGYNTAYLNVINHKDNYGPDVVDKNEVCVIVFTTF